MVLNTKKNLTIRTNMYVCTDKNVNGMIVPNMFSTVDDSMCFEKYVKDSYVHFPNLKRQRIEKKFP